MRAFGQLCSKRALGTDNVDLVPPCNCPHAVAGCQPWVQTLLLAFVFPTKVSLFLSFNLESR